MKLFLFAVVVGFLVKGTRFVWTRRRGDVICIATIMVLMSVGTSSGTTLFLNPGMPYLSSADSPFNGTTFNYFYLESFEDGALNTPGVSSTTGGSVISLATNSTPDSVDADDGVIDGSGLAGHSYFSGGVGAGTLTMTFVFDAGSLGALPTHVGFAWTDVGYSDLALGYGNVLIEAFGAGSSSLGTFGPFLMGDGDWRGQTDEDRFFGVVDTIGILSIAITMSESQDWEIDHLQYGFAAPTPTPIPGSLMLLGAGLGGLALYQRRKMNAPS